MIDEKNTSCRAGNGWCTFTWNS